MRKVDLIRKDIEHVSAHGTQEQLDALWLEWFRAVAFGIAPDRLSEILEAERDGRCVVLPCKIGDTVYLVEKRCPENSECNWDCKYYDETINLGIPKCYLTKQIWAVPFEMSMLNRIDKDVFTDRAAAENAMKGDA